jgi:hypothetical protein
MGEAGLGAASAASAERLPLRHSSRATASLPPCLAASSSRAKRGLRVSAVPVAQGMQAARHLADELAFLGRAHIDQHGLAGLHQRPGHGRAHAACVAQPCARAWSCASCSAWGRAVSKVGLSMSSSLRRIRGLVAIGTNLRTSRQATNEQERRLIEAKRL